MAGNPPDTIGWMPVAPYGSLRYIQNHDQRLATLIAAGNFRLPGLSKPPRKALEEFREECGFRPSFREFLGWYRKRYPGDYAAVF